MGTDRPPLPGLAAGTKILDLRSTQNLQTSAVFSFSFAHQAPQDRRGIIEAHHSPHLHKGLGMLQRLPTAGVDQEAFCDLNGRHLFRSQEFRIQESEKSSTLALKATLSTRRFHHHHNPLCDLSAMLSFAYFSHLKPRCPLQRFATTEVPCAS